MTQSSRVELTLAELGKLSNGFAEAIVNSALKMAANDVEDRGDDEKDRVVTIKVVMSKTRSGMVETYLTAKFDPPAYRVDPTACSTRKKNGQTIIEFQPDSPHNPDQEAIPFDEAETA